jgi:hypothetical protein
MMEQDMKVRFQMNTPKTFNIQHSTAKGQMISHTLAAWGLRASKDLRRDGFLAMDIYSGTETDLAFGLCLSRFVFGNQ